MCPAGLPLFRNVRDGSVISTDRRKTYLGRRSWSDGHEAKVSSCWVYRGAERGTLGAQEEGRGPACNPQLATVIRTLKCEPSEDSQRVVVGRVVARTVVIGRPTVELRKDPILNADANIKSGTE
jgi:hypothetical protein